MLQFIKNIIQLVFSPDRGWEDLEQECEKAVMQIDDRMYAKTLEDRYDQVSCFGIAFYKKRCLIQKK